MTFLQETKEQCPDQTVIYWINAAFAVHPEFRSHTGSMQTLGKGSISSVSTKQKVDSQSSTEAEQIAIDNDVSKVLWTNNSLKLKVLP